MKRNADWKAAVVASSLPTRHPSAVSIDPFPGNCDAVYTNIHTYIHEACIRDSPHRQVQDGGYDTKSILRQPGKHLANNSLKRRCLPLALGVGFSLIFSREFSEGGVARPLQPIVFRVLKALLTLDDVDGVGVSRLFRGVGLAVVDDRVVEEDESARFHLRQAGASSERARQVNEWQARSSHPLIQN